MSWDNVDEDYLKVPRKWSASGIERFMLIFGPTSSVFDIVTYLLLYFVICPMFTGGTIYSQLTDPGGKRRVYFPISNRLVCRINVDADVGSSYDSYRENSFRSKQGIIFGKHAVPFGNSFCHCSSLHLSRRGDRVFRSSNSLFRLFDPRRTRILASRNHDEKSIYPTLRRMALKTTKLYKISS